MDIDVDYGYLSHLEDQVYELKSELKKINEELLDFKKVAKENAETANDRAEMIITLRSQVKQLETQIQNSNYKSS